MIECTKFTEVNKGSLWGYADIYIPQTDWEIYGCGIFRKDGKIWAAYPSRNYESSDGKKKYWPHCRFKNKETSENFLKQIVNVIKEKFNKESVENTPFDLEECPF